MDAQKSMEKFLLQVEEEEPPLSVAEKGLDLLLHLTVQEIMLLIRDCHFSRQAITPGNIPQFSQIFAYEEVIRILMDSGEKNISFQKIGYYLEGKKKPGAMTKYGENHYKLTAQLGLATAGKIHDVTVWGRAYRKFQNEQQRHQLGGKICLRIPVIYQILSEACIGPVEVSRILLSYLSPSTVKRRISSLKAIFHLLVSVDTAEKQAIYQNIRW